MKQHNLNCPYCSSVDIAIVRHLFSCHIECLCCKAASHRQKDEASAIRDWSSQSEKVAERIAQERIRMQLFDQQFS